MESNAEKGLKSFFIGFNPFKRFCFCSSLQTLRSPRLSVKILTVL